MTKCPVAHVEAALEALLVNADLMHVEPSDLATWEKTRLGKVGTAVWRAAQTTFAKYEPLRPLFAKRELPARVRQPQRSCLQSAGIDLWRLRWDLEHLPPEAVLVVGQLPVKRVLCEYGARWQIGASSKVCNLFDALMALKEHYMNDGKRESRQQIVVEAALVRGAGLSVEALGVYVHLIAFAKSDERDGEPPTNKELAEAVKITEKRVTAALRELEQKGALIVELREGKSSLYAFPEYPSTPPQISRGSISYISSTKESHQEGNQESATPVKNEWGDKPAKVSKSKYTPEENHAIDALLKAWLDASGSPEHPYNKTGYRQLALNLHKAGVTPDDVKRYVASLLADQFYKKNGVSWGKVAGAVRAWAGKLTKPAAAPIVDPFEGQAPKVIG